ncbi:ABC transporter ATP-binding protein [Sphingobium sp. CAP-1]|uniref:ABC transporter ATP-binding protein n=1 Tax=Sphingobium sp. CAP-1 TaxID=2676077 RepID=UPI0012BB25B0|nr:ABC transporter ATP-binding protein [Sphingobium sp. CAP-1]QGP77585.1 ATP-binding cassette domain-containing protein [Sphingobium sp. CAP-1]
MIRFENVSKAYEGRGFHNLVLFNLNFTIPKGVSLGICGANGAGKSTLMRLLAGAESPTSGKITRTMSTSWPIGYTSAFQSSLSGADNARFIARIYGRNVRELQDFVENFAELGPYFHQPLNTYSAGMIARLAFGVSLAIKFECYLIDEVTAAGDERFRVRSEKALAERREESTLIMVSHVPETLRTYCSLGAVLYNGQLSFYDTIDEAIEIHMYNQHALSTDRAMLGPAG